MQALDAGEVRRWAAACVQALEAHRELIDRINVYPVADNDTGSNLLHTMRSALEHLPLPAAGGSAGEMVTALAKGALVGARGNSGVIASQLLRGLAEALAEAETVSGTGLHAALVRGAELARAAVADPVPGTMLSVLDAAAAAAGDSGAADLAEVVRAAAGAAADALERTPSQLAVLAEAGVVDAGGRGVVVLLDALVAVVSEQPAALAATVAALAEPDNPLVVPREAGSEQYSYEVMYLLDAGTRAASVLRDRLSGLGDCASVAGDGTGLWTVHVHCNDIGAAIEAGVESGRPHRIRVARFADAAAQEPARFAGDRAVVVPVRSAELAELLTGEGVAVARVSGGERSIYELLEVITGTRAAHVTVLPEDLGLIEVADEAAIRAVAAGQDVVVVPCSAPVQVLAAVAVHDPRRRAGDDVVRMAEAAAATRWGEVVVAAEDAITWVGPCSAGDMLGFADGEVVLIEPGPATLDALDLVARGIAGRMLSLGGELLTALLGVGAPDELAGELEDYLRREHPAVELVVYRGGQAAVLVLGVE
ncbi:MAG TPA: DAK2 domain-containing protein [Actinophytocola sp.]|uniref:DAK2 domain-containing protein n=1 Tax=Actinophytocola sp. TaxID=1872138 RepID=UPI002DBA29C4|nr:DAK2 domain-containing protein [Actinophytocola sp.]HEU5469037.1 DAK2 domain-containing protein [Actinophytocola sp.]